MRGGVNAVVYRLYESMNNERGSKRTHPDKVQHDRLAERCIREDVIPNAAHVEQENEHKSEAQRASGAKFARVRELELSRGADKEHGNGGCEEEG